MDAAKICIECDTLFVPDPDGANTIIVDGHEFYICDDCIAEREKAAA